MLHLVFERAISNIMKFQGIYDKMRSESKSNE